MDPPAPVVSLEDPGPVRWLHPALASAQLPGGGRGYVAQRPIRQGELLAKEAPFVSFAEPDPRPGAERPLLTGAGDEEEPFNFKGTIAFWCSVLFTNGSILFIVGATCSLQGVLPAGDGDAMRGLVAYPYFFALWFNFLPATYLVYFQVINRLNSPESKRKLLRRSNCSGDLAAPTPLVWIAKPIANLGHIASLCNLVGAMFFGLATGNMFINGDYTLVMEIPALTGSTLFIIGAVIEGEYNGWRLCTDVSFYTKLPVIQAFCYLGGASLFLLAYVSMWNHWSEASPERADAWVNWPFLVGSVFYLLGSMCSIIMWKKKIYGLGFSKTCSPSKKALAEATVDWRQQFMLWIYCLLMSMAQTNMGLYISIPTLHVHLWHKLPHFIVEYLIYATIMLLASVIHTTPDKYPYGILLWCMRFVALIDFFAQVSDFWQIFQNLGYMTWDGDTGSVEVNSTFF